MSSSLPRFVTCQACGLNAVGLIYVDGARMCTHCAYDRQVETERRSLAGLINWCLLNHICVYCGEPSEHVEHVVPRHTGLPTFTVRSCKECNLMASGTLFSGILDKQEYIHGQIRRKYAKVLRTPEWTHDELATVKGRLRQSIEAFVEAGKWVRRRLGWDIRALAATDGELASEQAPISAA